MSTPRDPSGDNVRPEAPAFGALLLANLRVLFWAALLALLAFGTWKGLRVLFPEVSWLEPGG